MDSLEEAARERNPVGREGNQSPSNARVLLEQGRPREAVHVARNEASSTKDPLLRALNLGGLLIDAGSDLSEAKLVREGVTLLQENLKNIKAEYSLVYHYNLGTGYLVLGRKERGRGPGTRPSLAEAVKHFDESLSLEQHPDVQTNLAAALIRQGRWIEALDELSGVLDQFPKHHVALAKHGSALIEINRWIWPHDGLLEAALLDYEKAVALAQGEPVFQRSCGQTLAWLRKRVARPKPKPISASDVENWIWEHRLALNPCPLCRVETPDAFDIFTLPSHLGGGKRRPSTDELLDLVNSLHRSYGTARWCLLQGMEVVPLTAREQIVLARESRRVRHDLGTGLLMTAFSEFYSLLGQVAFALNSYLHLGHKASQVTLDTIWSRPGSQKQFPKTRPEFHPAITRMTTPALAALYQLAVSLEHGLGRYDELRKLRNKIEHHVIVVADEKTSSSYFVEVGYNELAEKTIRMGRIARAALWYFGGTVWYAEYQRLRRVQKKGHLVIQRPGPLVTRI